MTIDATSKIGWFIPVEMRSVETNIHYVDQYNSHTGEKMEPRKVSDSHYVNFFTGTDIEVLEEDDDYIHVNNLIHQNANGDGYYGPIISEIDKWDDDKSIDNFTKTVELAQQRLIDELTKHHDGDTTALLINKAGLVHAVIYR